MVKKSFSQPKKYNKPLRRQMREVVLQTIFWHEIEKGILANEEDLKILKKRLLYVLAMRESEGYTQLPDTTFMLSLLSGTHKNIAKIQTNISKHIKTFDLPKISPIDRACLYIGVYELIYTDIPPKVAINEAIEVAKSFGATKSSSFINGILNSIYQNIENKPNK